MSTFVSTTVHCARCHDHKFDPITQEDYYGLQAVFAGVDRAERAYDRDPRIARVRLAQALAILPEGRMDRNNDVIGGKGAPAHEVRRASQESHKIVW